MMTSGSARASNRISSLSDKRPLKGIGVPPALKAAIAATR